MFDSSTTEHRINRIYFRTYALCIPDTDYLIFEKKSIYKKTALCKICFEFSVTVFFRRCKKNPQKIALLTFKKGMVNENFFVVQCYRHRLLKLQSENILSPRFSVLLLNLHIFRNKRNDL